MIWIWIWIWIVLSYLIVGSGVFFVLTEEGGEYRSDKHIQIGILLAVTAPISIFYVAFVAAHAIVEKTKEMK